MDIEIIHLATNGLCCFMSFVGVVILPTVLTRGIRSKLFCFPGGCHAAPALAYVITRGMPHSCQSSIVFC